MKQEKTKTLFVLTFLLFSLSLSAQDLIVTDEGDSLNCKITKINSENVYFTFRHKGEVRNTLIPLNQVKYHRYGFYDKPEVPAEKLTGHESYPHFRMAMNGSYSRRIGKLPDDLNRDMRNYLNELRTGFGFGSELSYYFSEQLGFGIKYSFFSSYNQAENVFVSFDDGTSQVTTISDKILINYIGPFMSTRLLNSSKKNSLFLNWGMGYLGYTNKEIVIYNYKISGGTLGMYWDIGYDIGLSDNVSVGFQLSYMVGTLMKYEISENNTTVTVKLDEGEYENLSRVDFAVGLRFNL